MSIQKHPWRVRKWYFRPVLSNLLIPSVSTSTTPAKRKYLQIFFSLLFHGGSIGLKALRFDRFAKHPHWDEKFSENSINQHTRMGTKQTLILHQICKFENVNKMQTNWEWTKNKTIWVCEFDCWKMMSICYNFAGSIRSC